MALTHLSKEERRAHAQARKDRLSREDAQKKGQIVKQLHLNGRDISCIAKQIGEKPTDVTARLARLRAIRELPS